MAIVKISDINTVKYVADILTPYDFSAYRVNQNMIVPIGSGNNIEKVIDQWIATGNIPEQAYTQTELDTYNVNSFLDMSNDAMTKHGMVPINDFNVLNLTTFKSAIECYAFSQISTFEFKVFCEQVWNFNALVQKQGKVIRRKVLAGQIPIPSEAAFRSMLPIF